MLDELRLTGLSPLADQWPDNVIVEVTSEYPPADAFMTGPLLVLSERFANTVEGMVASADIELLPVTVEFRGRPVGNYFVLHSLLRLDVLDRDKSIYTENDGIVDAIEKLAIVGDVPPEHQLFEIDAIEWVLCVGDELVNAIERASFSGVALEDPSVWVPF